MAARGSPDEDDTLVDARLGALEWGVACSAFQTEGGLNGPTGPQHHWRDWEASGRVEPSHPGVGLWRGFSEAVSRARTLGLRVFRLSLEWARLSPVSERLDPAAVRGYAARLGALRGAGIEPLVTLCHFTHPAWLGADFWLSGDAPEVFAGYAESAVAALNAALTRRGAAPLRRMVTLNEPNMLALASYVAGVFPHGAGALAEGAPMGLLRAWLALDHMLAAHVLTVRRLRARYLREGWGAPDCSTNLNVVDLYPLAKMPFDLLRAPSLGVTPRGLDAHIAACRGRFHDDLFDHGRPSVEARVARHLEAALVRFFTPQCLPRTLGLVFERNAQSTLDHLAIDVYDPFTANQLQAMPAVVEALSEGAWGRLAEASAASGAFRLAPPWAWRHSAKTLVAAVRAMHGGAPSLPIDIDECGMAFERPEGAPCRPRADGLTRPRFLLEMARGVFDAIAQEALPLRTFCLWTLVDNYELGHWSPRFGLYGLASRETPRARWSYGDARGDDAAAVYQAIIAAFATPRAALEGWLTRGGEVKQ